MLSIKSLENFETVIEERWWRLKLFWQFTATKIEVNIENEPPKDRQRLVQPFLSFSHFVRQELDDVGPVPLLLVGVQQPYW
jgi:hypothetical protein